MTTLQIIKNTTTYQNSTSSSQGHLTSNMNISFFNGVVECVEAGMTYDEWLEETCAGSTNKAMAKELFNN